jgi:glucosyl-3-phosphoglycerate synthase
MSEPNSERPRTARTFHHTDYSPASIARALERKGISVSVCLPARECAQTIAAIVTALSKLREGGVLGEVVVVDAASADGTAAIAREAGASVHQESELMPELGPVLGKGDAMYRALSVLSGDLVCYLDADSDGFSPHFATGLLGPLACEEGVSFVKAFYRRPMGTGTRDGGGRVNHLTARPALTLFYPELSGIRQPLAGEVAARRELLEEVPYATGYGVEIAMLIDVWRARGLQEIAQADLEEHRNRHQPLAALVPMAETVLATIARRLSDEGRLSQTPGAPAAPVERPPLREAVTAR